MNYESLEIKKLEEELESVKDAIRSHDEALKNLRRIRKALVKELNKHEKRRVQKAVGEFERLQILNEIAGLSARLARIEDRLSPPKVRVNISDTKD